VVASLNFQKSTHMEGPAVDDAGEPVTVRFTMAIRQAQLQLVAGFVKGGPDGVSLSITEVAHQQPLDKQTKVKAKMLTEAL
jgi:hypothetical protein